MRNQILWKNKMRSGGAKQVLFVTHCRISLLKWTCARMHGVGCVVGICCISALPCKWNKHREQKHITGSCRPSVTPSYLKTTGKSMNEFLVRVVIPSTEKPQGRRKRSVFLPPPSCFKHCNTTRGPWIQIKAAKGFKWPSVYITWYGENIVCVFCNFLFYVCAAAVITKISRVVFVSTFLPCTQRKSILQLQMTHVSNKAPAVNTCYLLILPLRWRQRWLEAKKKTPPLPTVPSKTQSLRVPLPTLPDEMNNHSKQTL